MQLYIKLQRYFETSDAKFTFTCLHLSVLAVFEHNYPTMIKISSLLFVIPKKLNLNYYNNS